MFFIFFFFSSRRRHTRCSRDWSSDVCSSDLGGWHAGLSAVDVSPGVDEHPRPGREWRDPQGGAGARLLDHQLPAVPVAVRSEEHTSELQSRLHLVCRLLLEKKNKDKIS